MMLSVPDTTFDSPKHSPKQSDGFPFYARYVRCALAVALLDLRSLMLSTCIIVQLYFVSENETHSWVVFYLKKTNAWNVILKLIFVPAKKLNKMYFPTVELFASMVLLYYIIS